MSAGDFDSFKKFLMEGNFDEMKTVFHVDFVEIMIDESFHRRPIHIACNLGHIDMVKFLIKHGCSIESETKSKWRPIHIACWYGYVDLVKLLIQKGCELECETNMKVKPIEQACESGHLKIVEILVERQCNIEAESDMNERPIHRACWEGHLDVVDCLIRHQCDIECETIKSMRPIHIVCRNGFVEIVQLLIDNKCEIFCKTADGDSPLELARRFYQTTCVKALTKEINKRIEIFSNIKSDEVAEFDRSYDHMTLSSIEPDTNLSMIEVALESNAQKILHSIGSRSTTSLELSCMTKVLKNLPFERRTNLIKECVLYRSIRDHHQAGFQWACVASIINGKRHFLSSSYIEWAAEHGAYAFVNAILKKSIYDKEEWTTAKNIAESKHHEPIADAIASREYLIKLRQETNFSLLETSICDGDVDMMNYILDQDLSDVTANKQILRSALDLARKLKQDDCKKALERLEICVGLIDNDDIFHEREPLLTNPERHEQIISTIQPDQVPTSYWSRFCNCCAPYPRPSGLNGASAECHLNCIMQAMASSEALIEKLENIPNHSQSLTTLVEVLKGLNERENVTSNTQKLEKLVQSLPVLLNLQQDSYELLSALTKCIDDSINANQIHQIFFPLKMSLVHRFRGLNTPDRIQDHLGLSLELRGNFSNKPGVRIEFLINEHFKRKTIEDDQSKSMQRFFYQNTPNFLIIHIRNKKDSIPQKYLINYDITMDLQFDIVSELNRPRFQKVKTNYKIKAVVQHNPNLPDKHTVTYRHWKNGWYLTDNKKVKRSRFWRNICPYILFYEQQQITILEQKPCGLSKISDAFHVNPFIQIVASSDILVHQFERLMLESLQSSSLELLVDLFHGINETEDVARNTKLLESLAQTIQVDTSTRDPFDTFCALIKSIQNECHLDLSNLEEKPFCTRIFHKYQDNAIPYEIHDNFILKLELGDQTEGNLEQLICQNLLVTATYDGGPQLVQKFFYKMVPSVLILQIPNDIKEFKGEESKHDYHIVYDQKITIDLRIIENSDSLEIRNEKVDYILRGMVFCENDNSQSHYVAYRWFMDHWYFIDDEKVTKTDFNTNLYPYLIIYDKMFLNV